MTSFSKFHEYLFWQLQVFENIMFTNFSPIEKRIKKCSWIRWHSANVSVKINWKTRSSWQKTCCYWLNLKRNWINQHFLGIFFFAKYEICTYLVSIYFHKCHLKRKFRLYLNLQNRTKFVKFAKIFTRERSNL